MLQNLKVSGALKNIVELISAFSRCVGTLFRFKSGVSVVLYMIIVVRDHSRIIDFDREISIRKSSRTLGNMAARGSTSSSDNASISFQEKFSASNDESSET